MADIKFPEVLPCAVREGYGLSTVSPLMRSELDTGRARQRRRYTSTPTMAAVTWIFTSAEAQVFEGFFRWTIKDGAEWFDAELRTPLGVQLYECRFIDIYSGPELIGADHWRVNADLEIRERPVIGKDWAEFPEFVINSNIIDLAMNREWPQ